MTSVIFKLRELELNRAPSPWLGPSGFRAQRHDQQQRSRSRCVSRDTKVVSQVRQLRGQESNLRTRGSKPRISTSRNYPAAPSAREENVESGEETKLDTGFFLLSTHNFLLARAARQTPALPLSYPPDQECPAGIEPACPAWKAGTSADRPRAHFASSRRKPWDSNPQRAYTRTCFRGRLLIQPDDFRNLSSCGDRNRTCVTTVNSRLPVPARTPPQELQVSVAGFEPGHRAMREQGLVLVRPRHAPCSLRTGARLSHTLIIVHRGSTSADGTDHPREQKAPSGS